MNPYREQLEFVDDKLQQAAQAQAAQRNMRGWRNFFILVTMLSGIWPWIEVRDLQGVQVGAALLVAVCSFETWRLGREMRRRFKECEASPPPPFRR